MNIRSGVPRAPSAPLIADDPALDFVNTVAKVDGKATDFLIDNDAVIEWLKRAGMVTGHKNRKVPVDLLSTARRLREAVAAAIERWTAGKPMDLQALNRFLAAGGGHWALAPGKDHAVVMTRVWQNATAEQILAPVAHAAAEVLVHGDPHLVKRCEDHECILWFYDRTKSHHRRWCSMATCGNRNKIAAFRARRQIRTAR
jgi:predicted RNA-binding Zn ribbon-like protein